jgi:hypothetical protein
MYFRLVAKEIVQGVRVLSDVLVSLYHTTEKNTANAMDACVRVRVFARVCVCVYACMCACLVGWSMNCL